MSTAIDSRTRIGQLLAGEAPLKWVFAGDSITHGAYHTFGHRDYVEHFAELIRWEKRRMRDAVITTAASGWKIINIAEDLEWSVLQYAPQVVSINVGMNDCPAGPEGVEKFGADYRAVLDRIISRIDTALILHAPNAIYRTPDGVRNGVGLYGAEVRKIAAEYHAVLVDHEKDWLAAEQRQALMYWLSDEIHPNEYGHRAMAYTLFRELGLFDSESFVCRLLVP